MTDRELIFKLQLLKQIKPNQEWVVLTKRQLLGVDVREAAQPTYREIFSRALGLVFKGKLAYAFAAFLLIFSGAFVFTKYNLPSNEINIVKNSQAALGEVKNNIETLKVKSQSLAKVSNNKSQDVTLAVKEVNDAVKSLTDTIQKNPGLAKEVALELKNDGTLLSIDGGDDLKQTSDDLYKTIDEQMISDLEKTSLTESQQETFDEANSLYKQGKYSEALEKILLVNNSESSIK